MAYTNVQFAVTFKIIPNRGLGKRLEIFRSREKIATKIFNNLKNISAFTLVDAGGSGYRAGVNKFSTFEKSGAYRPQFGQDPDIVTIAGIYRADPPLTVGPYRNTNIINDGTTKSGPVTFKGYAADGSMDPTNENKTLACTLVDMISAAVTDYSIIKLDVQGVVYGRGGFTFPDCDFSSSSSSRSSSSRSSSSRSSSSRSSSSRSSRSSSSRSSSSRSSSSRSSHSSSSSSSATVASFCQVDGCSYNIGSVANIAANIVPSAETLAHPFWSVVYAHLQSLLASDIPVSRPSSTEVTVDVGTGNLVWSTDDTPQCGFWQKAEVFSATYPGASSHRFSMNLLFDAQGSGSWELLVTIKPLDDFGSELPFTLPFLMAFIGTGNVSCTNIVVSAYESYYPGGFSSPWLDLGLNASVTITN